MKVDSVKEEGAIKLIISGRMDANTSEDFLHHILITFQKTNHVILDFEQVDYLSSAGLRALLIGQKTAESKKASMTLCNVCEDVFHIFKMTGFDEVLTIRV